MPFFAVSCSIGLEFIKLFCVFYQETPTHPGTWTASYSFTEGAGVLPELGLKLCSELIFIAAGMPVWIDQFITCLNCNYVWRVYEVLTIRMYPCGKSPTVGDFSSPPSLPLSLSAIFWHSIWITQLLWKVIQLMHLSAFFCFVEPLEVIIISQFR